jgi:membrane protein DedA with SNARE-associated domain
VIQQLLELIRIVALDHASLAKCISLLVLPFANEDLAIIFGGYIVVNDLLPVGLVAASIYGGMVVSDFVLYCIGAGARRISWLNRFAVDDRASRFTESLKRNLFGLVAFCRVVPGVFVALIACGWARVPLGRFTLASLIVSALYLPLMLYLVVVFGDALDDHAGLWTWPFMLAVVALAGFVRHRVFAFDAATPASATAPGRPAPVGLPHYGQLRPVPRAARRVRVR